MDLLDNKCPTCGAIITFNSTNQIVECANCSSKFTLEEIQQCNNASVEETSVVEQFLPEETLGDVDVYCCKDCGSEIMTNHTVAATFCLYCGSNVILKERILNGKAPDYIIPFKTTREDALTEFSKLTKGKLLMPKNFKDLNNIEKISGVYIPFWSYDLEANGEVEFEASDTKNWKDSNYKYKKIDRYSIRQSGHFDFLNILVDASTRFPDDLVESLEPFEYSELTSYNHVYLSGFFVEKYDVDSTECLKRITGRVNADAVNLMQQTVGHAEQKVINNGIRVSSRYTRYVMLPVWMINIKYKNKVYTFAMNGQTGKVVGNIPIGIKEAIIWAGIFFVLLFFIGLIGAFFVL